ncbi:MAG: hypothetical protein HY548_06520 [Elusimicrobia bacterium]|nr:hypothetical protein [Elusimicrobiota bacterium]
MLSQLPEIAPRNALQRLRRLPFRPFAGAVSIFLHLFLGAGSAAADLKLTALPLGDKTTSPKKLFNFTSSTQNVIMVLRVENPQPSAQTLQGLTLTLTNDTNVVYNNGQHDNNRVHLVYDADGDGDVLTPAGKTRADLLYQAGILPSTAAVLAVFAVDPDLVVPPSSVSHVFIVYDANDVLDDHATLDAYIASPSDVPADTAVDFQGAAALNSAGKETVDVIASTYQIDHSTDVRAGDPFDVFVKAVDVAGNVDRDANAVIRMASATVDAAQPSPNGSAPFLPADVTFVNGETRFPGVKFFAAAEKSRAGVTYVSGFPNLTSAGVRDSYAVRVSPADIVIAMDPVSSPQTAGSPFPLHMTIGTDAYGNRAAGRIVLLSGAEGFSAAASDGDDKAAPFSPSYSPSSVGGLDSVSSATVTVTLYRSEPGRRISATLLGPDGQSAQAPVLSNPFDVTHGPAAHFHLEFPTRGVVGGLFTSTVTAHDPYNNAALNYAGALRYEVLPGSDKDVLPADGPASGSVTVRPVSLFSPGLNVLSVTDTASPGLLSAEGHIVLDYVDQRETIVYPSPFRPLKDGALNIRFFSETGGRVHVGIYDFRGVQIREWSRPLEELGSDSIKRLVWDGKDDKGNHVPSGVYTCVTDTNGTVKKIKFGVFH